MNEPTDDFLLKEIITPADRVETLASAQAEIERLKSALARRYDDMVEYGKQTIDTVQKAYAAGRIEGLKEALKAIEEAGGNGEPITQKITDRIKKAKP